MKVRHLISAFLFMAICISPPSQVWARTWRVALDGSGDSDRIHEAAQWAASGDTIYVAPGRYSELSEYDDGWRVRYVVADIEGDKNLTIRGDSPDSVIVGPLQYNDIQDLYYGLRWWSTGTLVVENITIVNTYMGVMSYGRNLSVQNCRFQGNAYSIRCRSSWDQSQIARAVVVVNCTMESGGLSGRNLRNSLYAFVQDSVVVKDCRFLSSGDVRVGSSNGITILANSFLSGVRSSVGGHFEITGCYFSDLLYIGANPGQHAIVQNCRLRSHAVTVDYALWIDGPEGGVIELYDNIIEPAADGTVLLSGSSVRGSGNHILSSGLRSVRLENYDLGNSAVIDLRNNYWGTADSTAVAGWIWDANDDTGIYTHVEYMPMASGPVPAQRESLGGLKALFR